MRWHFYNRVEFQPLLLALLQWGNDPWETTAFSLVPYTAFSLFHIAVTSCLPHTQLLLQPCRASVPPPPKHFISHPFLSHTPHLTCPFCHSPLPQLPHCFQVWHNSAFPDPESTATSGSQCWKQEWQDRVKRDSDLRHTGALVAAVLWKGVLLVFVCTPHYSLLDVPLQWFWCYQSALKWCCLLLLQASLQQRPTTTDPCSSVCVLN